MRTRSWRPARALSASLVLALAAPALATPVEEDPTADKHATTRVRDLFLAPRDGRLDPSVWAVDLKYVDDMQRHHWGAVEMSELYLADPRGANPVLRRLARSIIANQQFEIDVLEHVRRSVEAGPRTVATFGGRRLVVLDRGYDGLEHAWNYVKTPQPSFLDVALTPGFAVSDYDVQFARPMIEHHQAALDMAMAYNADPAARNWVIRDLNYDLMIDQRYEIRFLRGLLDRYPGEPDAVPDDPAMLAAMRRSMAGMEHGEEHRH